MSCIQRRQLIVRCVQLEVFCVIVAVRIRSGPIAEIEIAVIIKHRRIQLSASAAVNRPAVSMEVDHGFGGWLGCRAEICNLLHEHIVLVNFRFFNNYFIGGRAVKTEFQL